MKMVKDMNKQRYEEVVEEYDCILKSLGESIWK